MPDHTPDPSTSDAARAGEPGSSDVTPTPAVDVESATHAHLFDRAARFVSTAETEPVTERDAKAPSSAPRGLWGEAWADLRKRPLFWISAVLIVLVVLVALFPQLFTSVDPTHGDLAKSNAGAEDGHPLGFTKQGYDVYARVLYGARASVATGLGVTVIITVFGVLVGAIAGFYGGWLDSVLSRITDVFFAIPLILAGIVLMQLFSDRNTLTVIVVLSVFAWPQMARIARSAVIEAKQNDYVMASRALGQSRAAILARHVIPNSLAPIIVMATTSLGIYIVAEATLSYLGIGLPPGTVSWGNDISTAQASLRTDPMILFWPSLALAVTVLGFIMLGDALSDALDPKERKR